MSTVRLRRRFSLHGVMILVTLVCVGLALIAFHQRRALRIQRAIQLLKDHGAAVNYHRGGWFGWLEDSHDQFVDQRVDYSGVLAPGCLDALDTEPLMASEQWVVLIWPPQSTTATDSAISAGPVNAWPKVLGALADLPDIRSLALHGELDDDDVARIAGLRQLDHLDLASTRITGRALDQMAWGERITRLDLSWTRVGMDSPRTLEGLRCAFPRLESLAFDVTHVPRESACEFSGWPNLKTLALTGFDAKAVRIVGLPRLARLHVEQLAFTTLDLNDLSSLERLTFLAKTTFAESTLKCETAIMQSLPSLESLKLKAHVVELAHLTSLRRLAISTCGSIKADDVPALEELSLVHSGCDDSALAFVARCGKLRRCDVSKSAAISQNFVATLTACPELRELRMDGCAIDDHCLESVAMLTKLSEFDCRNTNVTPAGIRALSERLPDLVVIHDR